MSDDESRRPSSRRPRPVEKKPLRAAESGDAGALRELVRLRQEAGDAAGAEALALRAADCGDTFALRELAAWREQAGDAAGAEVLYWLAADRADILALQDLVRLLKQAGDAANADRVLRSGLTGTDEIASPFDFESPVLKLPD